MVKPVEEIAPGVVWLPIGFVNTYLVGEPTGPWVLVDTGVPGSPGKIRKAAAERFGAGSKPRAIVLTHGHFDHSSGAKVLAELWNVAVYAHPLERPYLTRKSLYPPKDPTVGGAIGFMSRFFPTGAPDLEDRLCPLDPDGVVPVMPGWEWRFTPGHSPGHISLFRSSDRTLIAGDAFATVDLSSLPAILTRKKGFYLPGPPYTIDWAAAKQSVDELAALEPRTVACGHGAPLSGPEIAEQLRRFAHGFTPPSCGRYIPNPAVTDEHGVVSVPPPAPDSLPSTAAAVGAAIVSGFVSAAVVRRLRS